MYKYYSNIYTVKLQLYKTNRFPTAELYRLTMKNTPASRQKQRCVLRLLPYGVGDIVNSNVPPSAMSVWLKSQPFSGSPFSFTEET